MNDVRTEELKRNILSLSQWIRILYMVFYAIACWVLTIILPVIIIAQILISLITGRNNENLRTVGKKIADYFYDMLNYLVYASEEKPWPFDDANNESSVAQKSQADESLQTDSERKTNEAPADEAKDQQEQAGGDDVFADISFTDDDGAARNADKKVNTVDDSAEAGDGGSTKKKD